MAPSSTRARAIAAAVTAAALLTAAVTAYAVNSQGAPTTTLSNPAPGALSTYTFGTYMLTGQDIVYEFEFTFPAGFDMTEAAPVSPAATIVTKDVVARRLHLRLDEPWSRPDRIIPFVISGVRNAPAAGTYPMPAIRLLVGARNKPDDSPAWQSVAAGDIVLAGSHLNVSLSTSVIEFDLTPDVPAPPQSASLTVDSSQPYTITRDVAGDAALFGLTVEGQAVGAKSAGAATFTDTYSTNVPWTTEGDRTYTATVTYSIVQ